MYLKLWIVCVLINYQLQYGNWNLDVTFYVCIYLQFVLLFIIIVINCTIYVFLYLYLVQIKILIIIIIIKQYRLTLYVFGHLRVLIRLFNIFNCYYIIRSFIIWLLPTTYKYVFNLGNYLVTLQVFGMIGGRLVVIL